MKPGALVLGAIVLAACSTPNQEPTQPMPEPSVTVSFEDSEVHVFTPQERSEITALAEPAVDEVRGLLPDLYPAIRIEVTAGTTVIPETGELGGAISRQIVRWIVDPGRPGGPTEVARSHLRSTLFHELHHTVRGHVFANTESSRRVIDLSISEGMASVFERDAAGDLDVPWAQYPDDADSWVRELLALPGGTDPRPWLFEHPDGRRWIGYRSGAYLVDRAIAATGLDAADLVHTPAAEILSMAGYA